MGLQPVQLDTLNWQQIVTAIRGRIIPNSQGKWTLQAPVDPGVTLLELFAWLLDQRIYWISQVPDALVASILNLLGEAPKSAQAAATVLQLADGAQPPRDLPVALAGMLMRLGDLNPPVLFRLDQDLTVLPIQRISLSVNGLDRTNDLAQGRTVALIGQNQKSSEIQLVLHLSRPISLPPAGQTFSLLLQLETPADFYPQWSPAAADGIASAATLAWSYSSSNGTSSSTGLWSGQGVEDGTAGLRRSGIVRLPLPADWKPEPASDPNGASYAVTLTIGNANYTFAPRLAAVHANVVIARHRWKRNLEWKPENWPKLPGNVIPLGTQSTAPASWKEFPPIEDSAQLTITGPDNKATEWKRLSDLCSCGPTDSKFVLDRALAQIRFGDGLAGKLPVLSTTSSSPISLVYEAGGGIAGNVGSNLNWAAVQENSAAPNLFFSAVNLVPGEGGDESETLEQAQARVMAGLAEANRAVTKTDYENLAKTARGAGIRRAFAAVGYHPKFPCAPVAGAVTVFVVPYAPRVPTELCETEQAFVAAPKPDPGALQAVCDRLHAAKLLGGEVFAAGPAYRKVWLNLKIATDFPLTAEQRERTIEGLRMYLDPLAGGDDGNGWPFGNSIRPSALLKIAQENLGEAGDVLSVGVRLDQEQNEESCQDTQILAHELVYLVHANLVTQKRPVKPGGLR